LLVAQKFRQKVEIMHKPLKMCKILNFCQKMLLYLWEWAIARVSTVDCMSHMYSTIVMCKCGLHPGSPIQTSTNGIAGCLLGVLCSTCAPIRKVCPNLVSNGCLRAYVIEVASLGIGLIELFQINWLSCLYHLSG
jgi:hypothetical protein